MGDAMSNVEVCGRSDGTGLRVGVGMGFGRRCIGVSCTSIVVVAGVEEETGMVISRVTTGGMLAEMEESSVNEEDESRREITG